MLDFVVAKPAGMGLWWGEGQIGDRKVYAGFYRLLDADPVNGGPNAWGRKFADPAEAMREVERLFNAGPAALPELRKAA